MHPSWTFLLGDPILVAFTARFIVSRAVLAEATGLGLGLHVPTCVPELPPNFSPATPWLRDGVRKVLDEVGRGDLADT